MLLVLRPRIESARQFISSEIFINIFAKLFEFMTFFESKKAPN